MNFWQQWTTSETAQRLGWTLLHALWQGALVWAVLVVLLLLARKRTAQVRYGACGVALLVLVALPAVTFWRLAPEVPAAGSGIMVADTPSLPAAAYGGAMTMAPGLERVSVPHAVAAGGARGSYVVTMLQPMLPWLVGLWLIGVWIVAGWHTAGWLLVRRRFVRGSTLPGAEWREHFSFLAWRFGVSATLRLSGSAVTPLVVGVVRPVVLFPAALLTGLSMEQVTALLVHELAHVRRHDYLVNLLQSLVETVLFYHPAVWWISRQIRRERELCCDDLALAFTENRLAYASALAAVAEGLPAEADLAVAASGGELLGRIGRIVTGQSPRVTWMSVVVSGVILAGVSLTLINAGCETTARNLERESLSYRAKLVSADPVAAVGSVLPKGWSILSTEEDLYPPLRPEGKGKAIYLVSQQHRGAKPDYDAVVYIMPADYKDGGVDPTNGQAQTWPARLVLASPTAKIYLWAGGGGEWATMEQDIVAVLKASEAARLNPTVPELLAALGKPSWYLMLPNLSGEESAVRAYMREIDYQPRATDEAALLAAMNDEAQNAITRMCVAGYLLDFNNTAARRFILAGLDSDDPRQIQESAQALLFHLQRQRTDDWAINQILRVIASDQLLKASGYHDVYGEIGPLKLKVWEPELIAALKRHPSFGTLASAVGNFEDAAATAALAATLESGGGIRAAAMNGEPQVPTEINIVQYSILKQRNYPGLAQALARHLDDSHGTVAVAVCYSDDKSLLPALRDYVAKKPNTENAKYYVIAIARLEATDKQDMIARLGRMLDETTDHYVRSRIIGVLQETKDPAVIPVVLRMMQRSTYPGDLEDGIFLLEAVGGPKSTRALVALLDREVTNDGSWLGGKPTSPFSLQEWVVRALEKTTGQKFGTDKQKWRDYAAKLPE